MRIPNKKRAVSVQEEDEGVSIRVSRFLCRIAITTLVLGYFSTTVQAAPLPSVIQLLLDDAAPVITCPSDQTINSSISVDYPGPNATAVDDNDPNPTIVQSPTTLQSGAATTITATATDNLNQSSQCAFNVSVTTNLQCPPGQQPSSSINNTCEACPANTVSSGGLNTCEACEQIGYGPNPDQSSCQNNYDYGPSGTYVGCFQWIAGIADLQSISNPNQLGGIAPVTCVASCKPKGFAQAAVRQNAFQDTVCGCGNNALQLRPAPEMSCQPCTANPLQTCGSTDTISVYSTGVIPSLTR